MENVLKAAHDAADDSAHFFMIHYPEAIAEMWLILTERTGWKFHQWITWTYPSNIGMSNKAWTRASQQSFGFKKEKEVTQYSIQRELFVRIETRGISVYLN